jgi:MazG family protein
MHRVHRLFFSFTPDGYSCRDLAYQRKTAMTQIKPLLDIMAKLRDPNGGCPWDLEQNFSTIAPYTIEEAYEVAEAIAKGDMAELRDELGDLLLQVVFHAQMAAEASSFTFADVVTSISEKMIRRHPHVFGDATIKTAEAQTENWEVIKAAERKDKKRERALDDVPSALPALMRAQKLQARAARVGFDWPEVSGVIAKIREELMEVEQAMIAEDKAAVADELGDLLFAVTNLARFTGHDAETSLRGTNEKFIRRFNYVEEGITAQGKAMTDATLNEMGALWDEAKDKEHV